MLGPEFYAGLNRLLISLIPLLFGIILHEVAHGYAASRYGDDTARMLGRLTLNPIPHVDPMGLLAFVFTAIASPVVFGWAKPVPINTRNLRNPRKAMMVISFAGPFANITMALFCAVLLKTLFTFVPAASILDSNMLMFFNKMLQAGIAINFALAWLNLLPIPSLDGGHILEGLLPFEAARTFNSWSRYGFLILLLLLFSGVLGKVLWPLISTSIKATLWLVGI